jgi:hypothetical protein
MDVANLIDNITDQQRAAMDGAGEDGEFEQGELISLRDYLNARERAGRLAITQTLLKVRQGSLDTLELQLGRSRDGLHFSLIQCLLHQDNVDKFVFCTQNNASVRKVVLDIGYQEISDPSSGAPVDIEVYYQRWTKLAQGLGQLNGLKKLKIYSRELLEDPENKPDYRALGIVLAAVPQMEKLEFWCALLGEDDQFAQVSNALTNHPKLKRVTFEQRIDAEALDSIARQLITANSLSTIEFGFLVLRRRILPDSFFALLGKQSMTSLTIHRCLVSGSQCQLMADYLTNVDSNMAVLDLQHSRMERAVPILRALHHHQNVRTLRLSLFHLDVVLCTALGELFGVNQSIEELRLIGESFIDGDNGDVENAEMNGFDSEWLAPLFEHLQRNRSLKRIWIVAEGWSDRLVDSFGAFLQSSTCPLQQLSVNVRTVPPGWHRLLPALGTNASLKQVSITGGLSRQASIDIASHISRNTSIELLCLMAMCGDGEEALDDQDEENLPPSFFPKARLVEALGRNTTLRVLDARFRRRFEMLIQKGEGSKQLDEAFRKNYGIVELLGPCERNSMIHVICKLNKAGRKYLIDDPSNREQAIQVLAEVTRSLDALFFHLSENPSLCGGSCHPLIGG